MPLFAVLLKTLAFAGAAEPYAHECQQSGGLASPKGYNGLILKIARAMPESGGYQSTDDRIDALGAAIQISGGKISVKPKRAGATFCSAATYLVFIQAIARLQRLGGLRLSSAAVDELRPLGKSRAARRLWNLGQMECKRPGNRPFVQGARLGKEFFQL